MKLLHRLWPLAGLLWPLHCHALFGVGDIVYDPANVAQTLNLVRQAQQEFDRLGAVLGVSTQQLDQLLLLATTLGRPANGTLPALPGGEGLARTDGQLDAFLGLSPTDWLTGIEHPDQLFRATVLSRPTTQTQAADSYALATADWLQQARSRRDNLQSLSASSQAVEATAANAHTLSDQASAHLQAAAQTNRILLESAAQTASAAETAVRAAAAQGEWLQSAAAERRDAAELILDGAN